MLISRTKLGYAKWKAIARERERERVCVCTDVFELDEAEVAEVGDGVVSGLHRDDELHQLHRLRPEQVHRRDPPSANISHFSLARAQRHTQWQGRTISVWGEVRWSRLMLSATGFHVPLPYIVFWGVFSGITYSIIGNGWNWKGRRGEEPCLDNMITGHMSEVL